MKKLAQFVTIASILAVSNTYAGINAKPIFEKFVQPAAKPWSWQSITALPKSEYDSALPTFDTQAKIYSLSRSLKSNNETIDYTITGYGTKTVPTSIQLSSYTTGYEEEAKQLFKLSDIVNPKEVTKLKSNCTLKEADFGNGKGEEEGAIQSTVTQNIYKWSRPNASPLYIAEQQREGVVITGVFNHSVTADFLIAKSPTNLTKAMTEQKWNYTQNKKKVTCNFS